MLPLLLVAALAQPACLLDSKDVGGGALDEGPPSPCESYCRRAETCLGDARAACEETCPAAVEDTACFEALLSTWACLDMASCDDGRSRVQECDDLLRERDAACEGFAGS